MRYLPIQYPKIHDLRTKKHNYDVPNHKYSNTNIITLWVLSTYYTCRHTEYLFVWICVLQFTHLQINISHSYIKDSNRFVLAFNTDI